LIGRCTASSRLASNASLSGGVPGLRHYEKDDRPEKRRRESTSNKLGYPKFYIGLHAVIRVYDEAGNVIETHEHAGEFK
jgi:hypothetical protein